MPKAINESPVEKFSPGKIKIKPAKMEITDQKPKNINVLKKQL